MIAIQLNGKTHHTQGNRADAVALQGLLADAGAAGNDLEGARSPASGRGGVSACPSASGRLFGPVSAPPDLLHFVRAYSVREAGAALGLAVGTVYRLRQGYWPGDPRKIVDAWSQYKASRALEVSSWFLRRVRESGLVRHAGRDYTAPRLEARTGQLLAVARAADGGLLAQTLELPAERMPLAPAADMQGGAA